VNNPVVGLGASLADSAVVHPATGISFFAFAADEKVAVVFDSTGYPILDLGFRFRGW
jgi:hypothetical protein